MIKRDMKFRLKKMGWLGLGISTLTYFIFLFIYVVNAYLSNEGISMQILLDMIISITLGIYFATRYKKCRHSSES